MRGHLVKRFKDSWTIILPLGLDPATGKPKQYWESVKGTKKEAEKRRVELLHQLDTGTFMKPGKTTLAEFLQRWLDEYARPNLAPRTVEGYESLIRQHLVPGLGRVALTQLKPEHIQRYYSETLLNGRRAGKPGALSLTTLSHHHTCLHRALKMAVKWGLLIHNPTDSVTPPRPAHREIQTMSEDDVQALLRAAEKSDYYALFFLALGTGMRRSELLALRWCDVDLDLAKVSVSRSLHHLLNGSVVFRQPKTARGRRMIALPPSACLVLKRHRDDQAIGKSADGVRLTGEDLVFSHVDGAPLLPDTVSRVWLKAVKRAGLKNFRFHDARHSHASLMLKQNVHPKIVQERLGHATISTTLDLYSHVMPGMQEKAALGFDSVLSQKSENEGAERLH